MFSDFTYHRTINRTTHSLPEHSTEERISVTYSGRRFTKSALRIFAGQAYHPLSVFLASTIYYYYYLVCSLPIHKICALCGIFSAISVLLATENSDNLEIQVPDGSRSLKVTPVNSSCVISYQSLIVPEAVSCTVCEIQPSIGPPSLYFATPLAFNAPTKGFP